MQFKVPQFLDIEDKIFGPFTVSQFAYLAGGAGISFILYKLLGLLFAIIPILVVAGLALALTFYRPNGKPFIMMIQAWARYVSEDKLYLWKRRKNKTIGGVDPSKSIKGDDISMPDTKFGGSKLRDLAWSLDVLDMKKENTSNSEEI